MAFKLSPGVFVSEIDLTTIVPAVGTTEGAYAGDFVWGPMDTIVNISNEVELVNTFGKPDANTFRSFFTCANFLSYARNLRVVRANTAGALNSTSNGSGVLIKNRDQYELGYTNIPYANDEFGMFASKYPGYIGDSLKVSVWASSNANEYSRWEYAEQFDGPTGTSTYVENVGGANDEMHIIVIDEDGKFTGTANSVLEKFSYVSKAFDAKNDDGSSNYYVNVLKDRSRFIYAINHAVSREAIIDANNFSWPASANGYQSGEQYIEFQGGSGSGMNATINVINNLVTAVTIYNNGSGYLIDDYVVANISNVFIGGSGASPVNTVVVPLVSNTYEMLKATNSWGNAASRTIFTQNAASYTSSLSSGNNGTSMDGNIMLAYDKFANAEEVDVSLILTGAHSQVVSEYILDNIVDGTTDSQGRRDCVVFISPDFNDVVNQSGSEVDNMIEKRNLYNSSSYAVMDGNWKYQFDKYNNVYRWVPLNGDIAGLCVRTDFERDPWFSPAGFNRGQIKNVVRLAWNPTKSNRDDMYKNGINPVVSFPGEGVVLYGDKTMLAKPSAFDRINVRRLFIVLEKAIARAAKYSLFEFNDEFTRAQFVALVEPFLRDVQGRRGIYDFRVVCDTTNNTPEVIDRNEFIGDIYIKPARSINFIQLNFVAVRTGVAFEEVVGKF